MNSTELINYDKCNAFETAYYDYRMLVFHIAYGEISNWETAKDLTHEAFLRLLDKWDKFTSFNDIKAYLIVTIKNLTIDMIRHGKVEERYIDLEKPFVLEDYRDEYKYISYGKIIDKFRKILTMKELNVIILHIIDNLTFLEIASYYDMNKNQIAGIYHRAKEKLKNHYKLEDFQD